MLLLQLLQRLLLQLGQELLLLRGQARLPSLLLQLLNHGQNLLWGTPPRLLLLLLHTSTRRHGATGALKGSIETRQAHPRAPLLLLLPL